MCSFPNFERAHCFPDGSGNKESLQRGGFRSCGFSPSVVKIPWRRKWQTAPGFLPVESHGQMSLVDRHTHKLRTRIDGSCGSSIWFPGDSDGRESACNAGDPGSIPRSGRSPGEVNGNPL